MNLSTARTELAARGAPLAATDPRLTTFLNDAKNELEEQYDWPWLITTTTGTAPLTISDLRKVLYAVDTTTGTRLWGVSAQQVVEQIDTTITNVGSPEVFWLDGETTLKVYPANTSDLLSVRYVKFSPELSADSDTPLIPVRYHSVWIDVAMVRVYRDRDDIPEAEALEQDVAGRVLSMIQTYEERGESGDSMVITGASVDW